MWTTQTHEKILEQKRDFKISQRKPTQMNFRLEKETNVLTYEVTYFIQQEIHPQLWKTIYSSKEETEATEAFERIKTNKVFIQNEILDEWHPDSEEYF